MSNSRYPLPPLYTNWVTAGKLTLMNSLNAVTSPTPLEIAQIPMQVCKKRNYKLHFQLYNGCEWALFHFFSTYPNKNGKMDVSGEIEISNCHNLARISECSSTSDTRVWIGQIAQKHVVGTVCREISGNWGDLALRNISKYKNVSDAAKKLFDFSNTIFFMCLCFSRENYSMIYIPLSSK